LTDTTDELINEPAPEPAPEVAPEPGEPLVHAMGTKVLAVVGPTAVGKTTLAEELAVRLGGQIVSADSMQVYRGMDLGTAKPAPDERRVPYWCVDVAAPDQPYSAALFQRDARLAIAEIEHEGFVPIVAGGTGLYVRAAVDAWEFPPGEQEAPARRRIEEWVEDHGEDAAYERLKQLDAASAALIHPHNVRRVIRALEMEEEGVSYAEQARRFAERQAVYDVLFIGLLMDRDQLYQRIDARVDDMLDAGLLDEVRTLLAEGYRDALTASQAIGYKELVPVVEGHADLGEAVDAIKRASRRYAKRQLTWFRADHRVHWIDVTDLGPAETALRALDLVESWLLPAGSHPKQPPDDPARDRPQAPPIDLADDLPLVED